MFAWLTEAYTTPPRSASSGGCFFAWPSCSCCKVCSIFARRSTGARSWCRCATRWFWKRQNEHKFMADGVISTAHANTAPHLSTVSKTSELARFYAWLDLRLYSLHIQGLLHVVLPHPSLLTFFRTWFSSLLESSSLVDAALCINNPLIFMLEVLNPFRFRHDQDVWWREEVRGRVYARVLSKGCIMMLHSDAEGLQIQTLALVACCQPMSAWQN